MDWDDFMLQQREMNDLKAKNLALIGDNMTLSNTIRVLLNVKCKRSTTLSIELHKCLDKYFEAVYAAVNRKTDMKSNDMLVWMLTKLLRGTHNNETTCVVLDTNAILYIEKSLTNPETTIHTATTIEQFSTAVQAWLKQRIVQSDHEMSEVFSECWLAILNDERFEGILRRALTIYKQR
jgi:hypothetical protein